MLDGLKHLTFDELKAKNPGLFEGCGGTFFLFPNRDFEVWEKAFAPEIGPVLNRFTRAYPRFAGHLQAGISDVHSKCWLVSYAHALLTAPATPFGRPFWMMETFVPLEKMFKSAVQAEKPGKLIRISIEARHLVHHLEAYLFQIKSALDILAPVVACAMKCKNRIDGFHRRKDDFGRAFLNVLGNTGADNREKAARVIQIFEKHKGTWLDRAIQMRDDITHRQSLDAKLWLEAQFTVLDGNATQPSLQFQILFEKRELFEMLNEYQVGFQSLITEIMAVVREES